MPLPPGSPSHQENRRKKYRFSTGRRWERGLPQSRSIKPRRENKRSQVSAQTSPSQQDLPWAPHSKPQHPTDLVVSPARTSGNIYYALAYVFS